MDRDPDERPSRARDALACLALAPAVAVVLGLGEWAAAGLGRGLVQSEAGLALASVALLFGALGLVAATLSAAAAALGAPRPRTVALCLPPALLAAILVAFRAPGSPVMALAGLAVAWVALRVGVAVLGRARRLTSPGVWWSAVAALLAAGLALSSGEAPDTPGAAGAVAAAVLAAASVVLALLRRAAWPPFLGSAFAFAAAAWVGTRAVPVPVADGGAGPRPSVLLVTIDTLRADHVGAYGHAAARTPAFDALAADGTLFRTAVTQSVLTGPSHASILTGKVPARHGVLTNEVRLANDVATLADVLSREGWATGAFVGGLTVSQRSSGLPGRFDEHDDWFVDRPWFPREVDRSVALARAARTALGLAGVEVLGFERPAARTTDLALAWLERNRGRPTFTWVHMYDPHLPYHPPAEYLPPSKRAYRGPADGEWYRVPPGRRTQIVDSPAHMQRMFDLYDAEIAYADAQLARLVAAAREASDGDVLVVVTSDHGESMGEHQLYWFRDLYDPTLLVPLVVVPPPGAGEVRATVDEQVRLIDVAPTVLELLGVANGLTDGATGDGTSLVPLMRSAEGAAPGPAYTAMYAEHGRQVPARYGVRHGGWKLIHREAGWQRRLVLPRVTESWELYHLDADPRELDDVFDTGPEVLPSLEAALRAHAVVESRAERAELTEEEQEHMRSLGYVE